jgi:hypothetical protein
MALSVHNTDVLLDLAAEGYQAPQEIFVAPGAAGYPTTQAAALPLIGPTVRVIAAPTGNNLALVLPQTQPGGAGSPSPLFFIVNDSANSVVVFVAVAATGNIAEAMTTGGTTTNNGSLTIPAGESGVFALVNTNRQARGGGVQNTANVQLGWTGALLT